MPRNAVLPTHDELPQFLREWAKLTPQQQTLFLAAVEEMVEDLRAHQRFRATLRVKAVQGHPTIFEMTWAANGRATFQFGKEVQPGEADVTWRRIGGHEVFDHP